MKKSDLRSIFKEKRLQLSHKKKQQLSASIRAHFAAWLKKHSFNSLMSYVPFEKFNEFDPAPLETEFLQQNAEGVVYFPKMQGEHLVPILPQTQTFERAQFGIMEHLDYLVADPKQIDLLLLPLLITDRFGHRVGYGKGYYDRFIPHLRADCIKMGISFFSPIDRIQDVHEGDQALDGCIHPDGIIMF